MNAAVDEKAVPVLYLDLDGTVRQCRARLRMGSGLAGQSMTGHHRLAAHRLDWVSQHGEPRPPLIRAPRWVLRLWKAIDHARYVKRYGHAGPSSGQDWARLHAIGTAVVDGAVIDGERQTVRKADG